HYPDLKVTAKAQLEFMIWKLKTIAEYTQQTQEGHLWGRRNKFLWDTDTFLKLVLHPDPDVKKACINLRWFLLATKDEDTAIDGLNLGEWIILCTAVESGMSTLHFSYILEAFDILDDLDINEG